MGLRTLVIALVSLISMIVLAIRYGAKRWQSDTDKLYAMIEAARSPSAATAYGPREFAGLPTPVQRYFQAVLKEGQAQVTAVSLEHTGTFNMSASGAAWKPFTSTQRVITRRPGFVWEARIRMAPALSVFVHDAYLAGEGLLQAKLFGLLTVMAQPSTPELTQGELMRFLAEGTWYPTALLPGQGVVWEAIDDTQAKATLTDGTTSVSLVFEFDKAGLISAVYSDGRYREVDGVQVATPWRGRFWDYAWHERMLIPLEGEVAWLLPDGAKPYWRGRITTIQYEFSA